MGKAVLVFPNPQDYAGYAVELGPRRADNASGIGACPISGVLTTNTTSGVELSLESLLITNDASDLSLKTSLSTYSQQQQLFRPAKVKL
jgi:hypothetical protein